MRRIFFVISFFVLSFLGFRSLASGSDGPGNLFVPRVFKGVGGTYKYHNAGDFSYFCNIKEISAGDVDGDGDQDLVLLSGRRYNSAPQLVGKDEMYTTYPPGDDMEWNKLSFGDYLYGRDVTPHPYVSPNARAGMAGDPLHRTYDGSDLAWMENDGQGHFALHFIPVSFKFGSHFRLADLDGDGRLDIVVWTGNARDILWYKNFADAGGHVAFSEHTVVSNNQIWGGGAGGGAFNFVTGDVFDMNGDSFPDIITGQAYPAYDNYISPGYFYHLGSNTGPQPAAGYYDKSHSDSPKGENTSINCRGIWLKQGGDYVRLPGVTPEQVIAVDFDGDGDTDLVTASDFQSILINKDVPPYGKNRVFERRTLGPSRFTSRVAVGDLNNDGRKDVVYGNQSFDNSENNIRAYITNDNSRNSWTELVLPNGGGIWGARNPPGNTDIGDNNDLDRTPIDLALADVNGDGLLDIILASRSNKFSAGLKAQGKDSMVVVYVARHVDSNHDGIIKPSEMSWDEVPLVEPFTIPVEPPFSNMSLAIADFDGDGDLDIMRSSRVAPLVLYENVWNTQRRVRVTTEVRSAVFNKTSTDFLTVDPYKSPSQNAPIRKGSGMAEGAP